jgi:hypothetical protein
VGNPRSIGVAAARIWARLTRLLAFISEFYGYITIHILHYLYLVIYWYQSPRSGELDTLGETEMNRVIAILTKPFAGNSRFDRYYGNVLRSGEGYPTADEAKRDMRSQEAQKSFAGWMR